MRLLRGYGFGASQVLEPFGIGQSPSDHGFARRFDALQIDLVPEGNAGRIGSLP